MKKTKIMKGIRVDPFPNLRITEEAFNRDVVENSSNTKKQRIGGKNIVIVNVFNNGEKRVNAMLPETSNGKTFMSVFPNPIQLYYSFAIQAFASSEELR